MSLLSTILDLRKIWQSPIWKISAVIVCLFAINSSPAKVTDSASLDASTTAGRNLAISRGRLIWYDEFDKPLDITTSRHVGKWRANDNPNQLDVGYKDYSGESWNINPTQHPLHSPFKIANGVLTISLARTPKEIQKDIERSVGVGKVPEWSGGILISEPRLQSFRYGYFEFRARWPCPGNGMFPAMWLYVADGRNLPEPKKSGAEIDLFEIFGSNTGQPWDATVHRRDWQGAGEMTHVGSFMLDTKSWHVYGLDWQPDRIKFYRDGILVGEVKGENATWFDVDMSIRMNFTVNGKYLAQLGRLTDQTTPNVMTMEVDYVRVYEH